MGFVVLRTKAQNGFCPMCTKECHTVLTRSKPFWGQFWGQIGETDSDSQRSNKCAALVPLRNADTNITGFSQVKSSKNQYISFSLQQEVVRKPTLHHPRTPPPSPRETPLFGRIRGASAWYFRTTSCRRVKLIYRFVGLFLCVNPVMSVSQFCNETKAAHLI